jgi:hypothetical protein
MLATSNSEKLGLGVVDCAKPPLAMRNKTIVDRGPRNIAPLLDQKLRVQRHLPMPFGSIARLS